MAGAEINRIITLGPFEISKGSCTITLGEIENKVSPRSMDVLVYLIENSDRIVSTEELLQNFWSSVASDHAIHKAIAELRSAMGDSVRRQRYIKTVPKRGYKLLGAVLTDSATAIPEPVSVLKRVRQRVKLADTRQWLVGMTAVVILLGLGWLAESEHMQRGENPLVIGVAPFQFESNGIDSNRYLVDGLTSTLINGLSNLGPMEVLAISAAETTSPPARFSAKRLPSHLTHVLQGTLIQADDRLRVLVNLIRTADGVYEYSGRFDMNQGELFKIQDAIVTNIVGALAIHLDDEQRTNMLDWGTNDAIAYDRFMKAEFHNAQFNPDDWQQAINYYTEAVELDPAFISAHLGLSAAANNYSVFAKIAEKQRLIRLVEASHRAIASIDREHPALIPVRAIELRMAGNEYRQEEALLRQQILSGSPPEFAMAHYALLLMSARLYDEARRLLDKTVAVGPFEISPDEIWSYRISLLPPAQAIPARKLQLLERPKHVGFLGSVARELTAIGHYQEAIPFLERQRLADNQGPSTELTGLIVDAARGALNRENASFLRQTNSDRDSAYANGVASFMLGDLDAGAHYWRQIHPLQKRWLLNLAHAQEIYFPAQVLASDEYEALLEELDVGKSWQRTLMEGVMLLEGVTGVGLSESAYSYYQQDAFMGRNNLWPNNVWPVDASIAKLGQSL